MTVIVEEMPWLDTVSLTMSLRAGVVFEPDGQQGGMAVLQDWLERGAGSLSSQDLANRFNDEGIRRSSGVGKERMNFSASMLADSLDTALSLYGAILQEPWLREEDLQLAKDVALQDIDALADEPVQRLFLLLGKRFFKGVYQYNAYGDKDHISSLGAGQLGSLYERCLSPEGMIVSVAGGVTATEVVAMVERHFGNWRGQTLEVPAVELQAPVYDHINEVTSQTQIALAFASEPPTGQAHYLYSLALNVLSGGMASRLFYEVREKRGLVYSVTAFARQLRDFGYTLAYAGTTPERAQETLDVLQAEIRKICAGVSQDELERARTGMLSQLVMQGESSSSRASRLAGDLYIHGRPRSLEEISEALDGVRLDELNGYLAALQLPPFTVLSLGPQALEV